MLIPDINVLIAAARDDAPNHKLCREWLEQSLKGPLSIGLIDHVLLGFTRIITNRRVFQEPSSLADAINYLDELIEHSNTLLLSANQQWWEQFKALATQRQATGNLLSEVHIAALAARYNGIVVTQDKGFKSFKGYKYQLLSPR